MHALPRKHWACAVFFPRLPFSSWEVLLYSGMVRCVLCLTNIDRVCVVLFPRLLSVCTLCYIQHCSCMRSLPHKYQNFLSHARCHVIWHDVWPLWPIVVCSPFDFAMLERVVLVVFEASCTYSLILHWKEEEEGQSLITKVILSFCLLKSAISLAKCNFVHSWFIGNLRARSFGINPE